MSNFSSSGVKEQNACYDQTRPDAKLPFRSERERLFIWGSCPLETAVPKVIRRHL